MEFLEMGEGILAFRVNGKITKTEIDRCEEKMQKIKRQHPTLKMYAEIQKLEGYEVDAFFKDLKISLKNMGDFERAAVLSDKAWIEKFAGLVDNLLPMNVRAFELAENEKAKKWLIGETPSR